MLSVCKQCSYAALYPLTVWGIAKTAERRLLLLLLAVVVGRRGGGTTTADARLPYAQPCLASPRLATRHDFGLSPRPLSHLCTSGDGCCSSLPTFGRLCHSFSFAQCNFCARFDSHRIRPLLTLDPADSKAEANDSVSLPWWRLFGVRLHGNCSYRLLPLVFRYITRAQDDDEDEDDAPTGVRRRSHWLPVGLAM